MKFLTGNSKTTSLIKMAAERGGYIVVSSHDERIKIFKQAREMGLDICFPLIFSDILNCKYCARGIREMYFDNVDRFLSYMVPNVRVYAGSLRGVLCGDGHPDGELVFFNEIEENDSPTKIELANERR